MSFALSARPRRSSRSRARVSARFRGAPATTAGSVTFSSTLMPSSRLKNWNTIPMCRRRMIASSSSLLADQRLARERHLAVGRRVEPGDDVQQCRLPATRRAHHRDELARDHREVDAPQRTYGRTLGLEGLTQPAGLDDPGFVALSHASSPFLSSNTSMRYARTGVPPLDHRLVERHAVDGPYAQRTRASIRVHHDGPAGRARSCSRCTRFTVSPTSVYSTRSSSPKRPAPRRRSTPRCPRPNRALPRGLPARLQRTLAGRPSRRRLHRAVGVVLGGTGAPKHANHRVPDELHHGATLVDDRVVYLRPVLAELQCELGRVRVLPRSPGTRGRHP